MSSYDRYLIEAEHSSHPFETGFISSFAVANKVYKCWQSDPWVSNVRLMKCTNQGRVHIEI
jgi:hypothetical protein